MNNELLQKIQEKLGSAIDLINLENTEKVYNYAISYVKTQALMDWSINFFLLIISVAFSIFAYKKSVHERYESWSFASALGVGFSIGILIFFLFATYDLIITNLFPEMKVMEWLK